jgi:general stress protein CsbA
VRATGSSYADTGLRALIASCPAVKTGYEASGAVPFLHLVVAGVVSVVAGGLLLATLNIEKKK